MATWAIIETEHPALRGVRPDCTTCLDLAPAAIAHATATGARSATLSENVNGIVHSVRVHRAIAAITTAA